MPHPYIAFIDETGDYGLDPIDPSMPIFAMCAITSTLTDYLEKTVPELLFSKYNIFGTENIVYHGHKIRQRKGPFIVLRDEELRTRFMLRLNQTFQRMGGSIFAAGVHKPRLVQQYAYPEEPFFLSLQFLLERLHLHWKTSARQPLLCIFESRGKEEDKRTEEWFNRICAGQNYRRYIFHMTCRFEPKEANVHGHQLADLAAYTFARYIENRDETRLDWQAIRDKIATHNGVRDGIGLKIFP